ncbi:MAG: hypothetical protein P1U74_08895 [Legionellaceae bacterium]|nr:hypothetical protein [Legionellaceae bacterium]
MEALPEMTVQHAIRQTLLTNTTPSSSRDPVEIAKSINELLGETSVSNTEVVAAAVVASAAVVAFACYAIYSRLETVDNEIDGFYEMVDRHSTTYFIAHKNSERTDPDRYVNTFIESLDEFNGQGISALLSLFAGIHKQDKEKKGIPGVVYSAYSMASCPLIKHFERSQDDGQTIDESRQALTMFLRGSATSLLELLEDILKTGMFEGAKVFVLGEDHIREINSTRSLIIWLMNLALNLLYPMNPKTKKPVSISDSITLCTNLRKILSDMLSDLETSKYKEYKTSIRLYEKFHDFLKTLDARITDLQQGYRHTLKTKINLTEIINNSYSILQSMNNTLVGVLYPGRDHSDYAKLLDKVMDLDYLIRNNKDLPMRLVRKLNQHSIDTSKMGLNAQAATVIDVLAIFSYANRSSRDDALDKFTGDKKLKDSHSLETAKRISSYRNQFVAALTYIDDNYLKPLEESHGFSLGFSHSKTPEKIAATDFFVSFIALTLEVYGVNFIYTTTPGIQDANYQVRDINNKFLTKSPFFKLQRISDLPLDAKLISHLQGFIRSQFEMLMATRLINSIQSLIRKNQHHLYSESLQAYLQKRLDYLGASHLKVFATVGELVETAQIDKCSNQDLVAILSNINAKDLKTSIELPILLRTLADNIRRTKEIIYRSTFDDNLAENERRLIRFIKDNDNRDLFASSEEYDDFYHVLEADVRDDLKFALAGSQSAEDSVLLEELHAHSSRGVTCNISTEAPLLANSYFQLQAYFNIIGGVSLALLGLGILALLLTTFGVQGIPFLASMGLHVTSALMITGFACTFTGGIGLASSYFAPKFFKSPLVKFNHRNDAEEVFEDREMQVTPME